VDDIISFVGKVLAYTHGLERPQFEASGLTYDATVRNLELIGEAATRIPDAFLSQFESLRRTSNGERSFPCATV
jgi:uncharacterized protein with HEPN domain